MSFRPEATVERLDVSVYTVPTDRPESDGTLEPMLFEGAVRAEEGLLRPEPGRPGTGLELKRADAERFAA